MFEQGIVFYNDAIQNVYNVFYFKTSSMCNFNAIKKQSGFGFTVDTLFGNVAYLHSLYTVVELQTKAAYQNVSWFVIKQNIVIHNPAI